MNIFETVKLGNKTLKNKIVMAPMTRCRAIDNIPNDLMQEYYKQRADAGLIISEGTSPSPNGLGYPRIPGAFSPAQIEGWKKVAESVHDANGVFFVQLMHCGRISASQNLPDGAETIAPSPVPAAGEIFTETGMVAHDNPKEMSEADIANAINEFVDAADNLVNKAGVDGIEVHSANGYLLNQFLNPKSNKRTDDYGGSVENRCKIVLEIIEKISDRIGADKVGIRFSPYGEFNDMEAFHDEVEIQFVYLAEKLKELGIAYIHIVDQRVAFNAPEFKTNIRGAIKQHFEGTVISGGNVQSVEDAEAIIKEGADLIYVGRPFISNPDFIEKIKEDKPLKDPNPDLFYTPGAKGYLDY
ncbi:alkene reductase [Aquimarina agarivorans]|uniref:alkene reductase n=1 Tax=Aquimarina agarivorans TaxID=980584 RepID=UPI000494F054|nr:alkene reductase [Aquimarina agarivorans]